MTRQPRVLIVDDDEILAVLLKDIVEQCGAVVGAVAHTYDSARQLLDTAAFDLAFIDLRLGAALTGADLARQAAARHIQVVAVTGSPTLPEGLEGVALLTKPFSVETVRLLLDTLRRSLPD